MRAGQILVDAPSTRRQTHFSGLQSSTRMITSTVRGPDTSSKQTRPVVSGRYRQHISPSRFGKGPIFFKNFQDLPAQHTQPGAERKTRTNQQTNIKRTRPQQRPHSVWTQVQQHLSCPDASSQEHAFQKIQTHRPHRVCTGTIDIAGGRARPQVDEGHARKTPG